MPKVYIPQIVMKRSGNPGRTVLVPAFDFTDAKYFGDLVEVLPKNSDLTDIDKITLEIEKVLRYWDEDDYLLCVGDPIVIAICAGIILKDGYFLQMLRWDRETRMYNEVSVEL